MENLTSALTGLEFESKESPGTHSSLHKSRGKGISSQEERRRSNLELQKQRRKDFHAQVRQIVENEDEGNEEEDMDSSSGSAKKGKRRKRHMANQLMLSEWMVDVPPDLEENWCMVACPIGKRCLVATSRGRTRAYRKNGFCFNRFQSQLPAGIRRNLGDGRPVILDCIFNEAESTFYVLDVMCWMGHPVYDSDTEFRFFWLQAKFNEVPAATKVSNINPYAFVPLLSYSCSISTMENIMAREMPFKAELDGVLFYHKHTHYTPGSTPLVGWLKPWMLPAVLGVSIPRSFVEKKPPKEPWRPPIVTPEMECYEQTKTGRKQTK